MTIFPQHFVWGAASAAYQIEGGVAEGGRGPSIWDTFSHAPGNIAREETGDIACDSYHRWPEDLAALGELGVGAYRFSIAWPRIIPDGDGDVNEAGLAYYDALVDGLLAAGIRPYATLYHWDLPQALEDKGGWQNIGTARAFGRYARIVADHFRGRVRHWFTINEIACVVGLGYGSGIHAPGLRLPLEGQFACWQNVVYAHCLAQRELHAADAANIVGFASTGRLCYPVDENPADIEAARRLTFGCPDDDWTFTHQMALDPLCLGRWPRQDVGPRLAACIAAVPAEINAALAFGKPDMLGLNIYNAQPARMGEQGPEYVRRPTGYPRTALGWPVEPDSLDWGPRFIGQRYGLPMYITENGLSCNDKVYLDGQVHDADRIDFTARYLQALARGIGKGADVRGYFHWSLLDNFEWYSGYSERFGLYFMDYATGSRLPKDSARWYAGVVRQNGFAPAAHTVQPK